MAVVGVIIGLGALYRPRAARTIAPRSSRPPRCPPASAMGRLGAFVAARFGYELDPGSRLARQLGGVVCTTPVLFVSPGVGAAAVAWAAIRPVVADRRRRQRQDQRLLNDLPEMIDLLAVAVAGGRTVPLAIDDVVGFVPGSLAESLARCRRRAGLGTRLADELETLPAEHGELIRPLVRALVAAERYGTAIGPSLDAAAGDVRLRRRREAERRARQLPVKMLFPLVVCVLPAFALLTVVPVLVDAFSAIRP